MAGASAQRAGRQKKVQLKESILCGQLLTNHLKAASEAKPICRELRLRLPNPVNPKPQPLCCTALYLSDSVDGGLTADNHAEEESAAGAGFATAFSCGQTLRHLVLLGGSLV